LGKQILRCGTSVAENYKAACRGRSRAEFIAKLGVVAEEADESACWLEMLTDREIIPAAKTQNVLKEARELTAIFSAFQQTARSRN
jgi:four helix bundle protein